VDLAQKKSRSFRRVAMRGLWGPALAGALMLAAGAADAADHQITIKNSMYAPTRVAAKIGDTLTFVNNDTVTHEVWSPTPGHGFNLGDVKAGDKLSMTVQKAGHFDVECGLHPKMAVKVSVAK
jgi:plastocyanin